ncbi:conserved Plasmodium protein, unknown function [Plasmodium berghei]|uniref:tRNA pseudouridine(55) synthase n=2 Tax=Plasmodium berghei TaxID=5821 RepID=A0A509ARQ4_PLABA|nr:pseudouridine synthase, putative [Plasmodium berghei ANKA]CXI57146.1 conserved Plasmodium protein, unknown function [Plasmodium berghei]SCL95498.1 conserved Plasmodium protein, unknown function [Plasmodium berghei]SCM16273.1 conserved Plasmodium protein, unknown function [Plasmodium berghei]SCN26528.1 conserved Plasmodium protein, unknown function [Plasmodium berghei]VUC56395.1 pseudouridine synthase, putative [Plasmodium berghei ANKA]|eukprot:XP_034422197.1 pseudouridine synthase, putative [Plasmodium berghei ANKA]
MANICFRCFISNKNASDHDLLYFDRYFLSDYICDNKCEGKNEKDRNNDNMENYCYEKNACKANSYYLDNNMEQFLQYLNTENENMQNEFENPYQKAYINLYLCKLCNGLHNIDLIMLYNKKSHFHNDLMKNKPTLGVKERKQIIQNINNAINVAHNLLNNVDIILFFLYLYIGKDIKSIQDFTLESFQKIYEKIKDHIIIKTKIKDNTVRNNICISFTYTLIYVYLTFYKKVFTLLDLNDNMIKFITSLYKNCTLVFNIYSFDYNNTIKDIHHEKINNDHRNNNVNNSNNHNIDNNAKTVCLNGSSDDENVDNKFNAKKKKIVNDINQKINVFNILNENYPLLDYHTEDINNLIQNDDMKTNCSDVNLNFNIDIYVSINNLCIFGYYNKYNKNCSQTKWLINNSSVSQISVEECIYEIFAKIFPSSTFTFMAAGREDKDVRMMNIGRPFLFTLKETKFSFLNFYLFFIKLNNIESHNTINIFQRKTVQELFHLLKHYNKKGNNSLNQVTHQKNIITPPVNHINTCYALLSRKNTVYLYDLDIGNILAEKSKDIFLQDKNIANLHINTNYNDEIEVLLSEEIIKKNNTTNIDKNDNINHIANDEEKVDPNYNAQFDSNVFSHKANNTKDKKIMNDNAHMLNDKSSYNISNLVDVKFSNIAFSTNYELIKKVMKFGKDRKKAYKCIIYHSCVMTKEKITEINKQVLNYENCNDCVLNIIQKTPIRVLHRRGLINRKRKIYEFKLVFIHKHFSLLYLLAESGTYIKEFVNSDRGRTFPSVKYFFEDNAFVNILNLDVSKFVYDFNNN